MNGQVLKLPDGRQLGYITLGRGNPVVYFHGTASSRLEAMLLKGLTRNANLQIIGVDRPGYGLSTFKPQRNLKSFSEDINYLADYLGLERFGVLGWSGGGVFALAYLALFPERCTQALVVGTPSLPFDVASAHNMPFARFIMKIPLAGYFAVKRLNHQVLKANGDVEVFLKSSQGKRVLNECSKEDLEFFTDRAWMRLLYCSMVEAFRQGNLGVKAVVQEHQLFTKPWPFSFVNVPEGRLFVWHGSHDKTCRVSNVYAIVKAVPKAQLEVFDKSGHCVMFSNLQKISSVFSAGSFDAQDFEVFSCKTQDLRENVNKVSAKFDSL